LSQADQADDVTIKIIVIVTTVVIQHYVNELLSRRLSLLAIACTW